MNNYYTEPSKNTYVKATNEQIEQALQAQRDMVALKLEIEELTEKLGSMQTSCKHIVFYDTEGFPYDSRYCLACGSLLETI